MTQPPLNVEELMERIRAEAQHREVAGITVGVSTGEDLFPLLPVDDLPGQAALHSSDLQGSKTEGRFQELFNRASGDTRVSRWIPKPLRGLFRKQDRFNHTVLGALQLLMKSEQRLISETRKITAYLDAQGHWLRSLTHARAVERSWLRVVPTVINEVNLKVAKMEHDAGLLRKNTIKVELALRRVTSDALTAEGDSIELRQNLVALQHKIDRMQAEQDTAKGYLDKLRAQGVEIAAAAENERTSQAEVAAELEKMRASVAAIRGEAESIDQRQVADGSFLKSQISLHQRLLEQLAAAATPGKRRNGKAERANNADPGSVADHAQDAFYLAFENRFRGTRADIKRRMEVYLPFFRQRRVANKNARMLDLGCGRGEWLDLLKDSGYTNIEGVDSNIAMVGQCHERQLGVTLADALSYLDGLTSDAIAVLTAFHLIEHLTYPQLMQLLAEALRVLKPGGLLIFETPNPRNILVGASDFYRDMTHRNPIHPDTIVFALDTVGYSKPACYFLADADGERTAIPQSDFQFDTLAAYVDVPRDFAVLARKA